jgi:alkaline phosphatase
MIRSTLLGGTALAALAATPAFAQGLPQAADSYFASAEAVLASRLNISLNTGRAKNVIILVGDGMSVATVTAARIHEGQKRGVDGESNNLTLDLMPFVALSKTYSHDGQVSDSAPTATAMVSGVKTRNDVIGVNQTVPQGDCKAALANTVKSLFEMAEEKGLATGVISTARITHATPAATYAHTPARDWENDKELGTAAADGCKDIADQLVNWPFGDGLEVAMGGGRGNFLPAETADPEDEGKTGNRTDKRDLTAEWAAKSNNHHYVWNTEGLMKLDLATGPRILGLFERSHMEYEADRAKDKGGEPSLAEMTKVTLDRLQQDEDGFVLMIEGGRIDHAHHAGNAFRALEDTLAFDAALKTVLENTNPTETLVIVTADHSHTLTISGYPVRGNPILGKVVYPDGTVAVGEDGRPYTTLSYANGPGSIFGDGKQGAVERPDLSSVDTTDPDFLQQALVPMTSETHAGDDVAIYASGPFAHLFHGTVEQHFIFHVAAHALGWHN